MSDLMVLSKLGRSVIMENLADDLFDRLFFHAEILHLAIR